MYLAAATVPPSSCYIYGSCNCTFHKLMYLAAAKLDLAAAKYIRTWRMLLYLADVIVSESCNCTFHMLMYIAAATVPSSC
jgi:hypothetical protein